jgi:hypothetical protein
VRYGRSDVQKWFKDRRSDEVGLVAGPRRVGVNALRSVAAELDEVDDEATSRHARADIVACKPVPKPVDRGGEVGLIIGNNVAIPRDGK